MKLYADRTKLSNPLSLSLSLKVTKNYASFPLSRNPKVPPSFLSPLSLSSPIRMPVENPIRSSANWLAMDDDREQRLGVGDNPAEFSSSWSTLGHDSSDSVYFFGDDRESSILSEFGWSLHGPALPPRSAELLPIGADSAGIAEPPTTAGGSRGGPAVLEASTTSNHPSVSSDSSEDPAEKSTGSGGNPQPAETPWVDVALVRVSAPST